MKSFMLWLNQMIRGRADGASKRNLCPQERGIKQICDSVITDRTAADYRASAALSSCWCRHRHTDVLHVNTLEERDNTAWTIMQTILCLLYQCDENVNMQILFQFISSLLLLLHYIFNVPTMRDREWGKQVFVVMLTQKLLVILNEQLLLLLSLLLNNCNCLMIGGADTNTDMQTGD